MTQPSFEQQPLASASPPTGWWIASDGQWYPPELDPRRGPANVAIGATPISSGSWSADVHRHGLMPPELNASYLQHSLRPFPVWAVGVLHVLTLGLFSLIHFGRMHDRLPHLAPDDPTAQRAIGFQFIPFFNLYWMFFNSLRFTDRLNLQFRLRGGTDKAPRGLILACCIVTVIPDLNLVGLLVLWTVGACMLQSAVNDLATRGTHQMIGYGMTQVGIDS